MLEVEAAEKAVTAARERELRMIKKREAMESLLTNLAEGEESPNESMQDALLQMFSPMKETTKKTNIFRIMTRTLQSSMRHLHQKINAINIPSDDTNKQELRMTFRTMHRVAGFILLELTKIDPDGAGEYNSGLITRM